MEIAALAAEYLRTVLRGDRGALDFPAAAHAVADTPVPAAADRVRRREWRRQWRRLRLADQVAAYADALASAGDGKAVHTALARHAAEIVGAYTSIVFVPSAAGGLASLAAHPRALADGMLHLAERPDAPCLVTRGDLGRLPGLARLFNKERATSLVCQPFADDAVLVLMERRADRRFDVEDWELLRLVAAQAESALQRLRSPARIAVLGAADTGTGMTDAPHLDTILEHAEALAEWDDPLTVAAVELEVEIDSQDLRLLADELRRVCGEEGVAVRGDPGAYFVFLPGVSREAAGARLQALERRLPASMQPRHAIATLGSHPGGVRSLIDEAQRTVRGMRAVSGTR